MLSRRFSCSAQQTIDWLLTAKHLRRCLVFDFILLELRVRDPLSESFLARLEVSVEYKRQILLRYLIKLYYPTLLN